MMRPPFPQPLNCATWLGCSSLLLMLWLAVSQAQQVRTTLVPDGTLGTTVTQQGSVHTIMGGRRPGNGPNLFHSFDRFSVGTSEIANFKGEPGLRNILSRVTGGQRSEIDGTLRSSTPGVHLYLVNPSGVLFGANARLDVQGSFHVSTADYLRLADGARFVARLSAQSTLSVAPPAAFGFLGPTAAPIVIQDNTLRVLPGETLTIAGGDLTIAGQAANESTLAAPGGRMHLVSAASAGEVVLPQVGQSSELEVGSFARMGQVELLRGALVSVSGTGNQDAGEIAVRAGTLTLTGGSRVDARTQGAGQGGRVNVEARDIRLNNGQLVATTRGTGNAGEIAVQAGTLTLTEGASINTSSAPLSTAPNTPTGRAGRVRVTARDVLLTVNGEITAETASGSHGDAGKIAVQVDTLTLTGRARISVTTRGVGRGGTISVAAHEVRLLERGSLTSNTTSATSMGGGQIRISAPIVRLADNASIEGRTSGPGDGAMVKVQAGRLTLTGEARIDTNSVGAGRGGDITVTASEALEMVGQETTTTGITSNALRQGAGGRVVVSAPVVRLENGRIQAVGNESSAGRSGEVEVWGGTITLTRGARISSSSFGAGQGGSVTVAATEAILIADANSRIASEANDSGAGGNLHIRAKHITLRNGGTITASSADSPAGNIDIQVEETFRSQHSQVTTASTRSGGGTISLKAGRLVRLSDSRITTSVQGGEDNAGNLRLEAPLVILESSDIIARASMGNGGRIDIQARQVFLADPTSQVDASSLEGGIDGEVDIQASVSSISGLVVPLPAVFASAATFVRTACPTRLHEGIVSTLVERGHDGVPVAPDGLLPSRLALTPLRTAPAVQGGALPTTGAVWPPEASQHDPSSPFYLRGWGAALRSAHLLHSDCASR